MNSAYSSMTPAPSRLNTSCSFCDAPSFVDDRPVLEVELGRVLAGERTFVGGHGCAEQRFRGWRRRPSGRSSTRWPCCWSRPKPGAGGRLLSPISTVTAEMSTPSRSAAICAATVRTPVPISCEAHCTSTLPSAREAHARRSRTHMRRIDGRGTAQPMSQSPSRMEPGFGSALRPAERLGRLVIALHQGAAANRACR